MPERVHAVGAGSIGQVGAAEEVISSEAVVHPGLFCARTALAAMLAAVHGHRVRAVIHPAQLPSSSW